MFYLAASNQEGLLINPTHRILTNVADSDKIFSSIKSDFIIEDCNQISEKELKPNEFYVVCNNNNLLIKCTIREEDLNQFNNMSVFAVQDKIIDSHKELYSDIKFFKNLEDAESSLSENSIGLILPKFVPGDIMSVVLNNIKMPQKSTYFYPKVATGLLFNKLY